MMRRHEHIQHDDGTGVSGSTFEDVFRAGFRVGFAVSREGFNREYPDLDNGNDEDREELVEMENAAVVAYFDEMS